MPARSTDQTPVPGVLPPGFEFRSVIGQGGGGWVSLAHQVALDRVVAVKTVLLADRAAPAVRRLEREGRVLARLHHPGVVRVHQLIQHNGALYLVMEYLPGAGLDRAVRDGLSPTEAIAVLTDLATALEAVHRLDIAHRDLKPANIILHPTRGAVLVDFGLARLPLARSTFRTETGTVAGTPLYMAPEQIDQPDIATPSIDAYAFGVLAYLLLLGSYPYDTGRTLAELVRAHRKATPIDPTLLVPELKSSVASALCSALDKDPAGRPTPAELVAALTPVPVHRWTPPAPAPVAGETPTGAQDTGQPEIPAPVSLPTGAAESKVSVGSGARDPVTQASWIPAPVYRPARTRRPNALLLLLICLAGMTVGILVTAWWLTR